MASSEISPGLHAACPAGDEEHETMGDGADVTTKWVYSFGGGNSDGSASMKNLLGGKALMSR